MVKQDIRSFTDKSPQYMQADMQAGAMKGFVVDNRDPYMRGRCRVWCYGAQGDLPELDIYTLIWAEPLWARCVYSPPELGDRVLVSYENGDKEHPIYFGTWNAAPAGIGTLPWSKRVGSEVRPKGWHHRDLTPEGTIVGGSRNGNEISILDLYLSEKALASSIELQDVTGRYVRIWSLKRDVEQVWSPEVEFEGEKEGQLYQTDIGENKTLRAGYESLTSDDLEDCFGSIEMGYKDSERQIIQGKEDFCLDALHQRDSDGAVGLVVKCLNGSTYLTKVGSSSIGGTKDAFSISALAGVFAPNLLTPPRRWDDSDQEEEGMA